jgi:superfamily I DNA/RNA helicase
VVVDEAQDFHAEEWKLIRALVPSGANDLFLVGDAHQRIYGRKVALSRCGIQIQGRSSKLRVNYRTTEQIRAWAMAMLEGVEVDDLDGQRDTAQGYRSLLAGPKPDHHHFPTSEEEQEFLSGKIKELLKDRRPEEICLVAGTAKMVKDDYQALLKSLGINHTVLDKNKDGAGGGVRLATMHRVKGLEFPVMILAGVNSKMVPLRAASMEGDPTSKAEHEDRERSLLFVAATRARDQLIVTSWGSPSPFLSFLRTTTSQPPPSWNTSRRSGSGNPH